MDLYQLQERIQIMIEDKKRELDILEDQKVNASSITEQKVLIIKIEKKNSEIDTCDEILAQIIKEP